MPLLLDVHPQRLEDLAASRLALDAHDRREGGRARHRLEDAGALLLRGGSPLLRGRDHGLALVLALAALAAREAHLLRLLLLFLLHLLHGLSHCRSPRSRCTGSQSILLAAADR